VAWLNHLSCPVLSIDIPSGLDADTGRVLGSAVRASHTSTFIALKPGLLTLDGPDHCGQISVHGIGLPVDEFPAGGRTIARDLFADSVRPRPRNSHKGSWGDVGIVGGAAGMVGAALLAGRAALRLGAGRVFVGLLAPDALAVDPVQPELMLRPAQQVVDIATVLALGPGLGQSRESHDLLGDALRRAVPLVLDADALNLLAAYPVVANLCAWRNAPVLITPHPAEAARLLGTTTAQVQDDRVAAACELARRLNCVAVLKGCGSVVASARGGWFINGTGNPGMASAGMGDVLTGMAASLLAQGWPPQSALLAAVHLHGAAGDLLAGRGDGPVGLAATELIDPARLLFNHWIAATGGPSST
jgi:ADP-dependent NAD(P)H-hydrate dehydratase / NAD(P)H-hydrate epimerase